MCVTRCYPARMVKHTKHEKPALHVEPVEAPKPPVAPVVEPVVWDKRDAEVIAFAKAVQLEGSHALALRAGDILRKLGAL
jgi:hypothetical protein